jgi:type IV pilus assembly protein PilB
VARERRVIVFGKNSDGSYAAALENPVDLETIDYLTKFLQAAIVPYLASAEDLHYGFSFYSRRSATEFKKIIEENITASRRTKAAGLEQAAEEVPIVAIVDNLIAYAIASRASDIHLEILEKELMARYRIDGILQEITRIPKEVHPAVVARIKLLASLKLDEHAKPKTAASVINWVRI